MINKILDMSAIPVCYGTSETLFTNLEEIVSNQTNQYAIKSLSSFDEFIHK